MKIIVTKKASKNPTILANGDQYDGVLEIFDNDKKIYECNCNTDATINYNGGEVASGEYIYRRRIRNDGKVVFDILTKDGSNILPSTKPNPNHNGKKIIQAVQLHCGGITWDGSHGCITVYPENWQSVKKILDNEGIIIIKDKDKKKNVEE